MKLLENNIKLYSRVVKLYRAQLFGRVVKLLVTICELLRDKMMLRGVCHIMPVEMLVCKFYSYSRYSRFSGDLTSNVTETGLGELHAKRVARQLAAAVQHIHSRELVHRDIKLDNILVFRSDFSRIKLCDFGETRRVNTVVRRHNEWLPYSPPEVLQIDTDETYK